MDEDPRFRPGWTTEPAVEAIWRPLVDPEHPGNQPFPDGRLPQEAIVAPYYWHRMPPAQLAALFDLAPWERPIRVNDQPRFEWFLDPLAERFPEVTFHGHTHTKIGQLRVEGFELIGTAERVLEAWVWLRDQQRAPWEAVRQARGQGAEALAAAVAEAERVAWDAPDEVHLHRIGEGIERDGETGRSAHRPEDVGRWHYWVWWD